MANSTSRRIINGITLYRVVAAPFLLVLLYFREMEIFKWLLALSFFTDFIDGWLARRFKVTSLIGAKLDSIGDDLTVLVGVIGMFVTKMEFIREHAVYFIVLLALFIMQAVFAYWKFRKMTTYHTFLAKGAAILQGVFLILLYFLPEPLMWLFYAAILVTMVQLIEDIIITLILPEWRANVKGLYWVLTSNAGSNARIDKT